ncbi:MAG: hypothetical protein AAGE80_01450 [Pseudomonadota bacterium]
MKRFVIATICAIAFSIVGSAEAGFIKLGKLGNVGDAVKRADVPDSVLMRSLDGDGPGVALSRNEYNWVLTDALGRETPFRSVDDLDTALGTAGRNGEAVTVVVTPETLDEMGPLASALADRKALRLWTNKTKYRAARSSGGLVIEARPGLSIPVEPRRMLDEALAILDRPLDRVQVAELGKPKTSGPRLVGFAEGAPTRPGETALLTPDRLTEGMKASSGGTIVLTGRVRGDLLRGSGGAEMALSDLRAAAAAADVHLVVVNSSAKAARKVIDTAKTQGDLISAFASRRHPMTAKVAVTTEGRVRLSAQRQAPAPRAVPENLESEGIAAGRVAIDLVEAVVDAAVTGVEIDTRDKRSQRKIEDPLIPGLPDWLSLYLVVSTVAGFLFLRAAWPVFKLFWQISAKPMTLRHVLRFIVFILTLPLLGGFYFPIFVVLSILGPVRWILRKLGILRPPAYPGRL